MTASRNNGNQLPNSFQGLTLLCFTPSSCLPPNQVKNQAWRQHTLGWSLSQPQRTSSLNRALPETPGLRTLHMQAGVLTAARGWQAAQVGEAESAQLIQFLPQLAHLAV